MPGRSDPLQLRPRPRKRRRRHPLWNLMWVLLLGAAIGWLWYWVFQPLFTDPDQWAQDERAFRKVLREVVKGRSNGAPQAPELPAWPPALHDSQIRVLACADAQVARGIRFSASYRGIDYPWGDLPPYLGGSPDIVIRCLRSIRLDLQQLIHIDRVNHPRRYPIRIWANRKPDTNIDHRRLPNLWRFVKTYVEPLATMTDSHEKLSKFVPGDLIFWSATGGGEYPGRVGLVTDRRGPHGVPRVVTFGPGDDLLNDRHRLNDWPIMGHFRIDKVELLERFLEENPGARLIPRGKATP